MRLMKNGRISYEITDTRRVDRRIKIGKTLTDKTLTNYRRGHF